MRDERVCLLVDEIGDAPVLTRPPLTSQRRQVLQYAVVDAARQMT